MKFAKLTALLLVLTALSTTGCGLFTDPEEIISSITEPEETEDVQEVVEEEPEEEEEEVKIDRTVCFPAYLEELQMFRTEILGYYWQHGYWFDEDESRGYGKDTPKPVAIRDVTGDGMPELIYIAGVKYPNWEDYYTTDLRICTYKSGHIVRLYQDEWDVQNEDGFRYMLFTSKKDDYLHAYISTGEDDKTIRFVHFAPSNDGLLKIVTDLRQVEDDGSTRYYVGKEQTSYEDYQKSLKKILKRMHRNLMYGDLSEEDLIREQASSLKKVDKTYSAAVVYLGGREDDDAKAIEGRHRGNVIEENEAEVPEEEDEMTEEDYLREAREELRKEQEEKDRQKAAEEEKKKQEEERKKEEARKKEEEKKKQQESSSGKTITYSSSHLLTEAELQGVSKNDMQMAINEIYARHGYKFQSEEILNYFKQFSWYDPDETDQSVIIGRLNSTEKANVDLLRAMINR